MTVVLQHRFWDLIVNDDRFEVKLTFDSIPERLVVPFAAIKVFFDPSVPYGLQFEDFDISGAAAQACRAAARRAGARRRPGRAQRTEARCRPGAGPRRSRAHARRPQPERPQSVRRSRRRQGAAAKSPPTLVKPSRAHPGEGPQGGQHRRLPQEVTGRAAPASSSSPSSPGSGRDRPSTSTGREPGGAGSCRPPQR